MSKKSKSFAENFRQQDVKNDPQTQRFREQEDQKEERARQDHRGQGHDPSAAPDHDVIEFRAYQIYLERGGAPLDNWLEAERALKQESGRPGRDNL